MSLHALPDVRDPRRVITLDAVHNFRDMGGYPTADGRSTRWRTLFRADGLYRLTGDDLEVVRELGLRTVIDLRTPEELELRGRFPIDEHPVDFHHIDVMDTTWDRSDDDLEDVVAFLTSAYERMLHQLPDRFAEAIERLGAPDALPAVFHCAAGKDRTGVTAMLVLGALGVPSEYIAADYALTAEGTARSLAWAQRESPELWERLADTPSAWMASEPEAMLRVIAHIEAAHGSVRNYVLHIGVQPATLDRLASELLE